MGLLFFRPRLDGSVAGLAALHPEWTLAAGDLRCTVSPFGASLRALWKETPAGRRDLVWGYAGPEDKKGGQGDVLMPFPGRIAGATYRFEGAQHTLPRNDKEGPNAIHGFLRSRLWEGERDGGAARFRTSIKATDEPGYPFDIDVVVGYDLQPAGLACAFVARNAGTKAAPFAAGFHPYVSAGGRIDDLPLLLPADQVLEYSDLVPTGRVLPVPPDLDFRIPRPMGTVRLNHCFTRLKRDPVGFAHVTLGDVDLWMDPNFGHVVLYSGDALGPDARRALAVEPMTCATDAFNRPEWGLRVLKPGEVMSGTWGISLARRNTR